ncbi:MAG: enoyl-CoA hydratase-related protein [Anaerolineae bacterium]|nr:enoyl-CoA hydratase-related protein [Anaerolineae bacterium]
MAEYTNVKITIEDRVAVLTIDHPPANAFNWATLDDLDKAMDELIANDQVKVIIITGAGQFAFVAGADINEIAAVKTAEEARAFILKGQNVFNKIEACPKPVIAAINAVALGGGWELAMACHIRILSDRARIGQPESNLGIIPGWGGTQRLPRLVGPAKAIEMILTGDMINAQEAYRLGLANKVVPAGQVLFEAMGLAKKIASKSKLTNEATLRAVYGGLKTSLAEGLLLEADQFSALIGSHDTNEGVSAFLQKRQPKFTDS